MSNEDDFIKRERRRLERIDLENRRSRAEAARKRREFELKMLEKMGHNPDAQRVIGGLEDDRLGSSIMGRKDSGPRSEFVGDGCELSVLNLRFFESGVETTPPALRTYGSVFNQSSTRYVYFQLDMKNHFYGMHPHSHRITARYHWPNGAALCKMEENVVVMPSMEDVYFWQGYGFATWPLGTYRVDIFIDGEHVAQSQFYIR